MASSIEHKHRNTPIYILAQVISIIFHPLFITSYVIWFLLFVHPLAFAGFSHQMKSLRFITVFFSTTLLPLFSIFLLWKLKLGLQSLQMKSARERIIPYALVMIFYWWAWNVYRNLQDSPAVAIHFLLGSFLAVCAGWFANIYFKISMHALGAGGLAAFFLLLSIADGFSSGLILSLAILAAGMICTARLIVSDHSEWDIYAGFFLGILAQWVAWLF